MPRSRWRHAMESRRSARDWEGGGSGGGGRGAGGGVVRAWVDEEGMFVIYGGGGATVRLWRLRGRRWVRICRPRRGKRRANTGRRGRDVWSAGCIFYECARARCGGGGGNESTFGIVDIARGPATASLPPPTTSTNLRDQEKKNPPATKCNRV